MFTREPTRPESPRQVEESPMRIAQIVNEKHKARWSLAARGESRLVKGARTTLELAGQAIEAGVGLSQTDRRSGHRQAGRPRRRSKGKAPVLLADRPCRSRACLRHRNRAHPSRVGRRPRQDAQATSPTPPRRSPIPCRPCSSFASKAASRPRVSRACNLNGSTRVTVSDAGSRPAAISSARVLH